MGVMRDFNLEEADFEIKEKVHAKIAFHNMKELNPEPFFVDLSRF